VNDFRIFCNAFCRSADLGILRCRAKSARRIFGYFRKKRRFEVLKKKRSSIMKRERVELQKIRYLKADA